MGSSESTVSQNLILESEKPSCEKLVVPTALPIPRGLHRVGEDFVKASGERVAWLG